jgi:tetratricopeptide (TPR) repeat protein
LQSAVEQAAADLEEDPAGEDLDFITEHLTEAEVFAKYGLTEKATEHLRAIIERAPRHLAAHEKLYRLLLDDGDVEGARAAANQYMAILQERGDKSTLNNIQDEFMMRGHPLQPPAPKPPEPRAPTMERAMPSAVEIEEELSFDLDTEAAEFTLPEPEPEPAFSFDLPEPAPAIELPSFEPEPEPVLTFDEPAIEEEFSFEPPIDRQVEQPIDRQVEQTADQPVFAPEPFIDAPSAEELRELDFYIEQELFDEARQKLDALSVIFSDNAAVNERKSRFNAAIASITTAQAPAPAQDAFAPAVLSRDEIESELLSALPDDDDDFFTPAPPPPPPPRAAAPLPPPPVHEENLFADEDDFFDLAAELESELEEESEEVSLSEEEQSLEEIFKEFKKGVEQQLDSEDYDTHYNLGIAYKEMGLIDEAIGEFQLASKDPKRAVECASMLGLCFLEKGMPQLAIKWYRKGLEMPEILAEENVGLLYDLGSAYVEVGDTDNAQKAFVEVYSLNPKYRDIVTRIKQLEDARR